MPPLTDTAIRNLKPTEKAVKLFDGGGLYLLVKPNGARLWRMKYRVDGREKLISFGQYPDVPLKSARERRDEARRLIAARVGPSAKRQAERAATSDGGLAQTSQVRRVMPLQSPSRRKTHASLAIPIDFLKVQRHREHGRLARASRNQRLVIR